MKRPHEHRLNSPRLTIKQSAKYLGVCYRTMQNYVKDQLFPVEKISTRKHFIRQFDLDKYIEESTQKAA